MSDSTMIQTSDLATTMVLTAINRLEDKIDSRLVEMSVKIDGLQDRHGDLASRASSLEAITSRNYETMVVLTKRVGASEDRCSHRLTALEVFQSRAGVYLAVAAFAGATVVGIALKLLKLG